MELGRWTLSHEFVHDYLTAVGDGLSAYDRCGLVPPVALAARALGTLLECLRLPPGAIHSLQEIAASGPVPIGREVVGTAELSQPKRRGGLEFITATMTLHDSEGREALRSKSTVLVPDGSSASTGERETREKNQQEKDPDPTCARPDSQNLADNATPAPNGHRNPSDLPTIAKTITQEQLNDYARVSGDYNPIHLDADFASTTQFGGIIAHGMLTLAFISEMLTGKFGKPWLETGALRVRFKGAAYVGDTVEATGRVNKEEQDLQNSSLRRLGCAVGVRNKQNGQELISGTATVTV